MNKREFLLKIKEIVGAESDLDEDANFSVSDDFDSLILFNIFLLLKNSGYDIDVQCFTKCKTINDICKLVKIGE
ncbi:unknown [Succinatimonas sp. CAG:777]|nr:unknown [Succinatimonas sp. CAG:777]